MNPKRRLHPHDSPREKKKKRIAEIDMRASYLIEKKAEMSDEPKLFQDVWPDPRQIERQDRERLQELQRQLDSGEGDPEKIREEMDVLAILLRSARQ